MSGTVSQQQAPRPPTLAELSVTPAAKLLTKTALGPEPTPLNRLEGWFHTCMLV